MASSTTAASCFKQDVLAGRVALITGGGSGIGFEVARQFGLHGASVVLMGRRADFLRDASALLTEQGIKASFFAGDVRQPSACEEAVKVVQETYGAVDILVNAAAGNFLAAAEHISSNGFKAVLEIDTLGTFNMCRAAFEALKGSRFGGVVTNITATLHYTATWYQAAPVAAKAAIDALSRNLAMEWGEFGIRCNCVAPGPIADTPGMEKLTGGKMDRVDWSQIPARRAGSKAEIASACIYLCLNTYITGQIFPVDGGEWFGKKPSIPREVVSKISRGVEKQSRAMGPGNAKL